MVWQLMKFRSRYHPDRTFSVGSAKKFWELRESSLPPLHTPLRVARSLRRRGPTRCRIGSYGTHAKGPPHRLRR